MEIKEPKPETVQKWQTFWLWYSTFPVVGSLLSLFFLASILAITIFVFW